jgi:hypothetical protein
VRKDRAAYAQAEIFVGHPLDGGRARGDAIDERLAIARLPLSGRSESRAPISCRAGESA